MEDLFLRLPLLTTDYTAPESILFLGYNVDMEAEGTVRFDGHAIEGKQHQQLNTLSNSLWRIHVIFLVLGIRIRNLVLQKKIMKM